jgi:hypothetical protein
MGERGGKTISMNDEIPPVYTVSKESQRTRLTEVDLQFLQVITDLIVCFPEGQTDDKQDHLWKEKYVSANLLLLQIL